PPSRVAPDGTHFVNQGTSMATPHVTGSLALMLQIKPKLNVNDVRTLLASSATHDVFTVRTYGSGNPGDWWGFGKLNVKNAVVTLQAGTNTNTVAAVTITPRADTIVVNATTQVHAIASD